MSDVPDLPKPTPPDARLPTEHEYPATPDVPEVNSPADLRCSDVDRERVAEALRQAAGDGRLTLSELEERLEAAFEARTYGDLQPVTRDLPQGPYPIPGMATTPQWKHGAAAAPAPAASAAGSGEVVGAGGQKIAAILSEEKRSGRWEVPPRLDITNMLGNIVLDFTEAIVRSREVVIHASVVLGEVTLIVPEGIDVRMEQGANVLGERKMKLREPVTPGSPIYYIRGFVVLGQITVRPPKNKRRSILG